MKKVWTYLVIAFIALLASVNYELFVFPNQFAPSGINGICTMIQYVTGVSVGYLSLFINIPLAIWCYIEVSKPMAIRSMVYVVTFSLGLLILEKVDLSAFAYVTENGTSKILGPMVAGVIQGFVYSILIKKYTEQYDNFLVTRRVMLWAFITAVPLMLLTDGMPDLHPLFTQTNVLLSWLFLGVFGNAVCFAIWNIAFKRLGVVITNNYLYASPFVTLVVGFLLLDEQITVMSVIGAVLITVGVIVALKKPKEAV